jgi:hypothetical protein
MLLQMKCHALIDSLWLSADPSERLAPLLNPLSDQSSIVNLDEGAHLQETTKTMPSDQLQHAPPGKNGNIYEGLMPPDSLRSKEARCHLAIGC